MKLLKVYRTGQDLVIETTDGDRACKLRHNNFVDVDALESSCALLIGKEIKTVAFGDGKWDDKFFYKISEDSSQEESANELKEKILEQVPISRTFDKYSSQKIFGPPGTGKTTFLLDKVKEYVEKGVKPEDIAFISFSNAAANEAKKRVADVFPDLGSIDFPNFSTMHSLATKIGGNKGKELCVEKHWKAFDENIFCFTEWTELNDPFSVVSRFSHPALDLYSLALSRETSMLEEFNKKVELSLKGDYFSNRDVQSLKKSLGEFFNKYIGDDNVVDYALQYVDKYNEFKNSGGLVDFNDVILNTIDDNFDDDQMPSFEVLIIDEAQDLSDFLWSFAKKLISKAGTVLIAGDDDQAIMINFGASAHGFLDIETTEKDIPLPKSYRVPKQVMDYVNAGVMPFIEGLPNRVKKEWESADHDGGVDYMSSRCSTDRDGNIIENSYEEYEINDLLQKVVFEKEKEWLIIAPTKITGELISNALLEQSPPVPHFYRNKPKPSLEKIGESRIRVQTVHTSKGDQADNVAIVVSGPGDISMLANDPRLAYVALTRAKINMYPRVVAKGLLAKRMREDYQTTFRYMSMFPKEI